jgi:phage tail sheath protein FI
MAILPFGSGGLPGVTVTESTYGVVPAALAEHSVMYMLGTSDQTDMQTDTLYFISNPTDANNVIGVSDSQASIDLFFAQYPNAGFYFVNVKPRQPQQFTVVLGSVGATYSVTIDGFTIAVTGVTGDTADSVATKLCDKLNKSASHLATGSKQGADFYLRKRLASSVVTASSNITLGTPGSVASYPTAQDVLDSAMTTLVGDLRQGFVVAPEFYQNFTDVNEWALLANGLDVLCAQDSHKWVNVVDCMEATATLQTGAGGFNAIQADRARLQSPAGHSALYFPYWIDANNVNVPMSTSVVAIALKRYRVNYAEPPAGTAFPVYGTKGQTFKVNDQQQTILNPLGINCGRVFDAANLSPRKGSVVYGARTLSTSPFWRFVTTRVIANVLEGTLRYAFDTFIFTTVDGEGEALNRIAQTATSICERLRAAKALYGKTPTEAYLVVCDNTNNPLLDLENGQVAVDIWFKPSPLLERLVIRCHRTSLATTLTEVLSTAGDGVSTEEKPKPAPTESGS